MAVTDPFRFLLALMVIGALLKGFGFA